MGAKLAKANGSHRRPGEKETTRAAEILIRKLVAQTAPAVSSLVQRKAPAVEPHKLLFSGEVDGVRCMLVKTHPGHADEIWLSPREQEIARMIAKGYPNKTIASVLEISIWTVSTHLRRIFAKLGVNSRAAMVAQMSVLGILT